jgi:hypothetical protein
VSDTDIATVVKEVARNLVAIPLPPGSIYVLSPPEGSDTQTWRDYVGIAAGLSKLLGDGSIVLVAPRDAKIETFDLSCLGEDAMQRHGWVRAEKWRE